MSKIAFLYFCSWSYESNNTSSKIAGGAKKAADKILMVISNIV